MLTGVSSSRVMWQSFLERYTRLLMEANPKFPIYFLNIYITNPEDSSPSTTNQRPHDEVYETPRFSPPDAYRYCHARVAASRCLRENDGNCTMLSDIPDLSLSTPVSGKPAVGNTV